MYYDIFSQHTEENKKRIFQKFGYFIDLYQTIYVNTGVIVYEIQGSRPYHNFPLGY